MMADGSVQQARSQWVFGYGSLVSPTSLASTIGRPVDAAQVIVAELDGYGRRWNYGAEHVRDTWTIGDERIVDGVIVALGLVGAAHERCNGVVVRVTDDELARLDRRERDYDRTDVTSHITAVRGTLPVDATVVTYVPRRSAIERYERARDGGRAAIRRTYWDLVHDAFAALGADHLAQMRDTPAPDVPIVEVEPGSPS